MTTQLEKARRGVLTEAMVKVALQEKVAPEKVLEQVASGKAVIPLNPLHRNAEPVIVGKAFRTKVNANIGRSPDLSSEGEELVKMNIAIAAGADFVMDLSVGSEIIEIRRSIIHNCKVPVGTVPMYEAYNRAGGKVANLSEELLLEVIRHQAEEGVDFMTIHAGLLFEHVDLAVKRLMGIVSRGGAILSKWMVDGNRQNPFYTQWDAVMEICRKHDVTVSLGDGLRPGCIADASDAAQFAELDVLGELVRRCRESGVQVMVEGPGHVPFHEIQMNVERQAAICDDAPFYVLGPVVTDIAPGYDHITSCIGATAAAYYGAALLCYVTPAEHLGLPSDEEVHQGVIAYKIAAHAADVAKGLPGARDIDDEMSKARSRFDWNRQFELALDGPAARKRYNLTRERDGEIAPGCEEEDQHYCSMCGKDFCAVRNSRDVAETVQ